MSDALPLPPRPNLEQYKKLAKDCQSACKSSDPGAIRDWAARWAGAVEADRIEQWWRKFTKSSVRASRCMLGDAQFFLARAHGFSSWPKFAGHLKALARANSPVSRFEAAAEAIAGGDLSALGTLLTESPELVRSRSTREHRSTLLHYVSANGVEDFRQKTPKNILGITQALLKAGADVNAESDAYGGRSTPLGLTATSWHPESAGVQLALMELLIEHGAIVEREDGASAVNSCLGNGRGQAAGFLASRGARLDLEGASGVGRLDVVKSFFASDGSLKSTATESQMKDGFAWACEFGRTGVVDFLLKRGMDPKAKLRHDGQTGLHWAAYGGHADTVKLLLSSGAPIGAKDDRYGGTPLGWALYGWQGSATRGRYYEAVALLVRAGATADPQGAAVEKARSDPRMLAALRGESEVKF